MVRPPGVDATLFAPALFELEPTGLGGRVFGRATLTAKAPMQPIRLRPFLLAAALAAALPAAGQHSNPWLEPNDQWAGAASADGETLSNGETWQDSGFLSAAHLTEDCIVKLEFMLPEGSRSGLYLHSRYKLQISDSYGDESLTPETLGGIGARAATDEAPGFEGRPPLANAAKPAGEWQTLEVAFRAPRFDEAGKKTESALFLEVKINGVTVQENATVPGYTGGARYNWEQPDGAAAIDGSQGPISIRRFEARRADFGAIKTPEPGQPSNRDALVDLVAMGAEAFLQTGCIECHATKAGDASMKTGPNLWGLFQLAPRQRLVVEPGSDAPLAVEAGRSYLHRSVREPNAELALAETGPTAGQPYLPIMPPMPAAILSETKAEAIYRYLLTLNDPATQGPVVALAEPSGPAQIDPLADSNELLVARRVRIQRGSMPGVSGRSIHVGQPNGVNYTFDPRTLSIERLWQGGFLNAAEEWQGRGGNGFRPGFDNREIPLGEAGYLVAPVGADGGRIDFSFKEAIFRDYPTIERSLRSEKDHLDMLAEVDAAFLGYSRDSADPLAAPRFEFRVGENSISLSFAADADGKAALAFEGALATPQSFLVNARVLTALQPSAGSVANGVWTLPAGTERATLEGTLHLSRAAWRPAPTQFDFERQPLQIAPSQANLPPGYSIEEYLPPKDNYGRDMLFEALGIDLAPDGTIVVATRTSGIWRIADGAWQLFAEGLFDSLGVVVEDARGLQVVASQKPELTRISDADGDGAADRYQTLSDQFSYHSNYHSYMHGPVRDAAGNYFFNLNLLHTDEAIYKADGLYMGASGGFSGWAIKLTPQGEFIPWANGLRSPAGVAFGPDGRLWYSENQGEFVGTSKLFLLEEGKFYGHPSGLVDLPGMTPDSDAIRWERVAERSERAVVLFPHGIVANSPGHPTWDATGGAFGPFAGQIFIGDQTRSNLLRVVTEVVDGVEQGCVIPFADELQSGVMRPVFLPDGSLLLGQTGRGWQADGGKVASLQRIVWDGSTVAPEILAVHAIEDGFEIAFTQPIADSVSTDSIQERIAIASWRYRDAPDYGSPELDKVEESIEEIVVESSRRSVRIRLAPREKTVVHPQQTARVFHIAINADTGLFEPAGRPALDAYYTRHD